MIYTHSITEHTKRKHLTAIERGKIAGWLGEGFSHGESVRRIGVTRQTISNELARGTIERVHNINGIKHFFMTYDPEFAQSRYGIRCQNCHHPGKLTQFRPFLAYFVTLFKTANYDTRCRWRHHQT